MRAFLQIRGRTGGAAAGPGAPAFFGKDPVADQGQPSGRGSRSGRPPVTGSQYGRHVFRPDGPPAGLHQGTGYDPDHVIEKTGAADPDGNDPGHQKASLLFFLSRPAGSCPPVKTAPDPGRIRKQLLCYGNSRNGPDRCQGLGINAAEAFEVVGARQTVGRSPHPVCIKRGIGLRP